MRKMEDTEKLIDAIKREAAKESVDRRNSTRKIKQVST